MSTYRVAFNFRGTTIIKKVTASNETEARTKARESDRRLKNATWLGTKKIS